MSPYSIPIERMAEPANDWRSHMPLVLVATASVFATWLIWRATASLPLVAGVVGLGMLAMAVLRALSMRQPAAASDMVDGTDWTLVRMVADSQQHAIAITDRSGRLVCANDLYCEWFEGAATPPGLTSDARQVAMLADMGRTAWREGEAALTGMRVGDRDISGSVSRIGRAGDHLLWRWQAREQRNAVGEIAGHLGSDAGQRLSESGVMAVLVSAAGTIRASNAAFRMRAAGSDTAIIDGQDFAELFRISPQGTIRFAREQDRPGATPVRIIEIATDAASPTAPFLMLLVDEDGGASERGIAIDYVEKLLSVLPVGMAMVDREGRFQFINQAFQSALGIRADRTPTYPSDLVVAEDKAALSEAVRRHAGGVISTGDLVVRTVQSPDEALSIGFVGVRGMGDLAVLLTLSKGGDSTTLNSQMTQATKMQAVGQLAGGIAHDFNNILTAILGNCDLMLARHSPGDTDYDDIQQVRSNANRAANLTRQLLAFSRQQTLRPQILNLSDIVADVSHLLQRLLGETVTLDVVHGRGLGPVRADPVQLEQVIVNLAVNARDAMPSGGKLVIATESITHDQSAALQREGMPPGEYSLLKVSDTGTGIAADVLNKIFDPFFTTKDLGKGTGLGLATVYGIVKQSGGYVFADSIVGQGTCFSIYLPVYSGPDSADAAPAPAERKARSLHWGNGTILLVEDEDMVRAVAERALVRAGYTVVTASHGEDGLEKIAALDQVDLVISDVMMPTMDGPTMVQAIRQQRGDLPVLFMSGYAEEQLRQSIAMANVAFLPKPFSVAQLVDAVADIKGVD